MPPDGDELARLLAADPATEVRAAAARRCTGLAALSAAWENETDAAVRSALAAALGDVLASTPDAASAATLLAAEHCNDAIRSDVARRAVDADRRRAAIAGIRDEEPLVELALAAEHAETRKAAAQRVRTAEGLRRLADAAKNKDRGVARLARQRIDALDNSAGQVAEADAILENLELLANDPGPILTAVVELDRRWQALDMSLEPGRVARRDAVRQILQTRFDRENALQRTRTRFERRLGDLAATAASPGTAEALAGLRALVAELREEAQGRDDLSALARLDREEQRIVLWDGELAATASAEALVVEAEQLASGTSIDNAKLPERWQTLDRKTRTPALTQRFEVALVVVEQRRLAQMRNAQHQATAARQTVHGALHAAEVALAAGHLQPARAAVGEIRELKPAAGTLPKPTLQRLGRVAQQLADLERWESFGQHQARVQLCERAEAMAAQPLDAPRLAQEVQKLRGEWKALDQQHAGVPKALWERFDSACEKAYAPAARHFAQVAAERKEARQQREAFIAAAESQSPAMLGEQPDWRAIERFLRDTDRAWREGDLGSVEPGTWKKLDARLRAALAPLRDALSSTREQAKAGRLALIAEATALVSKAMERDVPSQVKAIQGRWQEQAKAMPLAQRDERALWEQFRAACDAVFGARQNKRKEDDDRRHEGFRALDAICTQLEQLARATEGDESTVRRALRDLQEQWKAGTGGREGAPAGLESRFRSAKTAVEAAIAARTRSREAAVWLALAAKERLCEELESGTRTATDAHEGEDASATALRRWADVPSLPAAWETRMVARRDAALRARVDAAAIADYAARIEAGIEARGTALLELEMALGLESPAELQAQRLALKVKKLRERFTDATTASANSPQERLLAWCAQPGIADARDRQRLERVFAAMEQLR